MESVHTGGATLSWVALILPIVLISLAFFVFRKSSGRTLVIASGSTLLGIACLSMLLGVVGFRATFVPEAIVRGDYGVSTHDTSHVVATTRQGVDMSGHGTLPIDSVTTQSSFARVILLAILVVIIVTALLFILANKFPDYTMAIIIGGGCSLLWIGLSGAYLAFQNIEVVPGKMAIEGRVGETHSQRSKSTAELWDKLTESRIQLDDVEATPKASLAAAEKEPEITSDHDATGDDKPNKAARPAWLDLPSRRVGNVYRQVIVSDRYSTVDECFVDLEDRFQSVVQVRLQSLLNGMPGSPFAIPKSAKLGIDLDYIMSEICREEFTETVSSSVGDMKRVHVQMEFDSSIDNHLKTSWQRHERLSRLKTVGGIAGLTLGILALVFGLLIFDTWTRGYYTRRLLIGVPAAIIVLVLLFVS